MNDTTTRRRRYSAVAAAVAATAAITLAACGTETGVDKGKSVQAPAGGAPQAQVQAAPFHGSADTSERLAQLQYLESLRRHYTQGIENKKAHATYRHLTEQQTGHWRELRVP